MECEHMVHWGRASFIAPWSRIVRRVSVVMCALWSKVTFSGGSASVSSLPSHRSFVILHFVQSPYKSFNLTKHKIV